MVEGILDNAEAGCSPEQIAGPDIYPELDVAVVRRILLFAYKSELNSLCEAYRKCPNLPRAYKYRAGVLVREIAEIARACRATRPRRKPRP